MTEAAWAASKTKDTYLKGKYHSMVGRRGKKRTAIALGHKILIMAYHVIKYKVRYKELGVDYLDKRRGAKILRYHVKRLESLGYGVALIPKAA